MSPTPCLLRLCLLWLGVAVTSAATPVTPLLTVYSGQQQTGEKTTFHDSAASLADWDDRIRSICISGFWVFFENDQYNGEQAGGVLWALGINGGCLTLDADYDQQVSSLRRVGDYDDASLDSLTLYEGTYFSGSQVFTEGDMSNVTSAYGYQSVIVSGPDAWTIYSGDNYSGQSVCLYSGSTYMYVDDKKIEYGLFGSPYELGPVGGDIGSVRRGCHATGPTLTATSGRGISQPARRHSSLVNKANSRH